MVYLSVFGLVYSLSKAKNHHQIAGEGSISCGYSYRIVCGGELQGWFPGSGCTSVCVRDPEEQGGLSIYSTSPMA